MVNWTKWEQNVNITLNNGEKLYVKNNESILSEDGNWTEFRMTGLIGAHGNINCLRNENPTLNAYAFKQLFNGCTSLTTPPMLTSETLADFCYYNMFKGCTNLRRAPELRAKTLKTACYQNMFEDCENMVTGPEILPATVATDYCYNTMFHGCSSLIKGPHIKITTIGTTTRQIMQNMFDSCTALNELKFDYTSSDYMGQEYHFRNWVYGVASDGTFYYNGSYTDRGPNGIPEGWSIVTY